MYKNIIADLVLLSDRHHFKNFTHWLISPLDKPCGVRYFRILISFKNIYYLFGCARVWLWHVGS